MSEAVEPLSQKLSPGVYVRLAKPVLRAIDAQVAAGVRRTRSDAIRRLLEVALEREDGR
jgi:Arc/MetJ-type ribon-helix-helix transcriptional regulator